MKIKGKVYRDPNFIRVFDKGANIMYEFAVNGTWSFVKVGSTMPNGFVLSQDVFDSWYEELGGEETFDLR